jgi:hypothetical protein
MSLSLLILFVVLAVAAGLYVGSVAARQLQPGPDERQSLGKRARRAATRQAFSWWWKRRRDED